MGFQFEIADAAFIPTPDITTKPKSWLHWFCGELKSLGYCVRVLILNSAWYSDIPRERLYIVYVNEELGGHSGVDWIATTVKEPIIYIHIHSYMHT